MSSTNGDDRDATDEAFPLGDDVAATSALVVCPYCAEPTEIALDPGSGMVQTYEEDCEVCCRPWVVHVKYRSDGEADVAVEPAE
jgi:hypothetical protein